MPVKRSPHVRRWRVELQNAVDEDDRGSVAVIVAEAADAAAACACRNDVTAIVTLRSDLHRTASRLAPGERSLAAAEARAALAALDRVLDRARTIARQAAAENRGDAEAPVVRERVAALIAAGPRRPREIVEALGCDPSQVSRALRELRDAGDAVRADPPAGARDRRGHWYAAAA